MTWRKHHNCVTADDADIALSSSETHGGTQHLSVTYRPLASLIPCARNARTHLDAQVAEITASIGKFG